jgi:F-box-like
MAPSNLPPTPAQRSAVEKIVAQQQAMITHLQELQAENLIEHARLDENGVVLQSTMDSMKSLRDIGLQIRNQLLPLFTRLERELNLQESNEAILSSLLPSTITFLRDWKRVKDVMAALLSALMKPLESVDDHVLSVAEELDSTETVRDQMSDAITTLHTMTQTGLKSIVAKQQGVLHPLRRIPNEILLTIFHACVEAETDELRRRLPHTPLPRTTINLSGVCARWRHIILQMPQFWSYIHAPYQLRSSSGTYTGEAHFENFLSRSRGSSIELTLLEKSMPITHSNLNMRILHRLNVHSARDIWPPNLPSPEHLWVGQSDNDPPLVRTVPLALLSRTTRVTTSNIHLSFPEEVRSVKTVVMRGSQSGPFFGSLMRKLPELQHLDLRRLHLGYIETTFNRNLSHPRLSSLAISASALAMIDLYIARGLRLPALRHFTIDGLTGYPGTHSAFHFSQLTSHFKGAVSTLEISGASKFEYVRSWIDALGPSLDAIVACGRGPVVTVVDVLYGGLHPNSSLHTTPRIALKITTSLVIRKYPDDGKEISQQLETIKETYNTEDRSIKVIFDSCLNILPSIRTKF